MSGDRPSFPSAPGGQDALKQDLDAAGLKYEETEGRYGDPERSLIIHGPTREQMYALGKKYGQESVIHSENGKHQLLYTNGPNEGQHHPSLGTYDYFDANQEPPEDYYTKLPNQGAFRLHFDFNRLENHPLALPTTPSLTVQPQTVTKHEIGHKLYQHLTKLVKAYEAVPGSFSDQDVPAPGAAKAAPQASPSFPWLPHPHAYDWHDGHTDHHFGAHASGGVAINTSTTPTTPDGLVKHDPTAPAAHPHTDGAVPELNKPAVHRENDQAAGKGVKTYAQYALPFGHISPDAKAKGGSNLFHYDYNGKNDAVNKLVSDHGFQTYYAGGKFGKPDLANRNYNTKHLMVYDPTDASASFNDPTYTDSWRKTHELSHALVYPQLNAMYGEGRRIGKLGHHRTLKEALRAVHWEWLAAHKQRELNKQLGIEVPEETFNRELNTVMHDAAHRAVTGKFTEPSSEGFEPHSYKVPLETSLNLVRDAARNLGLQGETDLLKKSENPVADDKDISIDQALHHLHEGLKKRIDDFAQAALELRKKETAALEKPKKLVTNTFHGSGKHLGDSVQPSNPPYHKTGFKKDDLSADGGSQPASGTDYAGGEGGADNMNMSEAAADAPDGQAGYPAAAATDSGSGMALKEKNMKKNVSHTTLGPKGVGAGGGGAPAPAAPAPAAPAPSPGKMMLPGELSKHDHMCKCESCGKVEHYAKSALAFNKSTKEEDDQWEADKVQAQLDSKKKQGAHPYRKDELQKKSPPGRKEEVEKLKAKGLPASEAFGIAWKQQNEKGKPAKKSEPNTAFNNSAQKGKLPPETGGKEVGGSSEGGNDGTDTNKGKKLGKAGMAMGGAAPAMPKAPKLAGAAIPPPHPGMKPAKLPGVSMTPKLPKPAAAPKPAMGAGTPSPVVKGELAKSGPIALGQRAMAARQKFGERTQAEQARKLPGVQASTGALMDQMLASKGGAPAAPAPSMPSTLAGPPMGGPAHPALAAVGQPVTRPAQGVQTMAERVASKMPAGPSALAMPAGAKVAPKLPGALPAAAASPATMQTKAALPPPAPSALQHHMSQLPTTRKNETPVKKAEWGLALSEMGPCALCKKAEHSGPCK